MVLNFNSDMVRLREWNYRKSCALFLNFNSDMVRLRDRIVERINSYRGFQFRHGAIKRSMLILPQNR